MYSISIYTMRCNHIIECLLLSQFRATIKRYAKKGYILINVPSNESVVIATRAYTNTCSRNYLEHISATPGHQQILYDYSNKWVFFKYVHNSKNIICTWHIPN